MNKLELKNVLKIYPNGVKAINNVSLRIGNGMFGLLGPNGAGKSSLMRTIAGLQQPDDGTVLYNGTDVVACPIFIKKQLGFLPQYFGVYPKISAYSLMAHLATLKGLPNTPARKEQILALLDKVNLYGHRHKEAHAFSGGMRQRLGIAQALLGQPRILIVDEPTAGLDPEERNRFNNLLAEIGQEVIVILSTHLVEDVRNLCTNMAVMNHGSVLAEGKPSDFLEGLAGKIWQKTIDRGEHAHHAGRHQVLSSQLNAGKPSIRICADSPPGDGFVHAPPTLEDAYFSLLNSHASNPLAVNEQA